MARMTFLKTWSIPIGRLFGVDLRLHLSFLFLFVFILAGALDPKGAGLKRGALLLGSVLLSVFVHEAAHMVVAGYKRMLPRINMLLPIGGVHLRDAGVLQAP